MTATDDPTAIDITPNKDGGVLKTLLREGHGDEVPFAGDTVSVHYVGKLLDGTQFDSSRDRGEKFSFEVGKGSVIKGWDMGIPTMKRGELASFEIKSEYGYGARGSPPTIPPDATLVFEVELFDFHGEDLSEKKDKSIVRRVLKAGTGYMSPNEGAQCVLALKGTDAHGRVFDQREHVEFELGEGAKVDVCEGVEAALLKCKKEEVSRVEIKAQHVWRGKGNARLGLEPGLDVVYEIEVKNFEKAKESWQLNGGEKLEQSELIKNKGTELFKKGEYDLAMKKYNKILDFLEHEVYDTEERKAKSKQLQIAARLNVAACFLKLKEYHKAVEACNKVLELDEKNEKSLFRMAQAHQGLAEFDEAIKYYSKVLEVNAENKEAAGLISVCHQKIKEYNQKEKALYGKMFSALSK